MNFTPQEREERYKFLCREIERLIERHKDMPTEELKSRVSAQITMHVRELDDMEMAHIRETSHQEGHEIRDSTFHAARLALGAGVICILLGLLFGLSILTLGGLLALLVSVSSLTGKRSPRTPHAEPHSWEWKP